MMTEYGKILRSPLCPSMRSNVQRWTIKLLIAVFVQLFLWAPGVAAFAADGSPSHIIEIAPDESNGDVNRFARFYLEEGTALTLEDIIGRSDAFADVTGPEPDFGYYSDAMWLKLDVKNISDAPQDRMLMLLTNFMSEISVYFVTNGNATLLLDQDKQSVFETRPVAYHELVAPFTIGGGEKGEIYIRYLSQGDTVLPLFLETPLGYAQASNQKLAIDFSFYGIMVMLIVASLVGRIFFKNDTFLAYALYAAGVLLLIFQRDGYAFQFLWPNAPAWNDFSSLVLGSLLPVFAAIFTRSYLSTKTLHPDIDKVLIGVGVVNIAVVASAAIIGPALAKQIALLAVTVSIVVFISIGVIALRHYGARASFFVIGWSGLLLGTASMAVIHWFSVDITRAQSLDIMRSSMVFDALMMGLASVFRIVNIQRDSEQANKERIAVLDANVQLLERFRRLEQKHQLAQSLADTQSQAIVDTTHDLRQPLFSLRSAISDLVTSDDRRGKLSEIEQSFDYIEELVESTLERAIDKDEAGVEATGVEPEVVEVRKLFKALRNMFQDDARENSVDLRFAPSRLRIKGRSFVLLRIMSNLISNAIRYAPDGKVLVGARPVGDSVSIVVYDQGPGIKKEELSAIMERSKRGAAANEDDGGIGVGLSILAKLAAENDLDWKLESEAGAGTRATIFAPRWKET